MRRKFEVDMSPTELAELLMVRVPSGLKAALSALAHRQGRPVAAIVREALDGLTSRDTMPVPVDWQAELDACEDAGALHDLAKRLIGVVTR